MNTFTAPHGNTFQRYEDHVEVRTRTGMKLIGSGMVGRDLAQYAEHVAAEALAKRDAVIGRWRWPENPDYVVYPIEDTANRGSGVWVVCESEPGAIKYLSRPERWHSVEAYYARAARAYFNAHPEKKEPNVLVQAQDVNEAWVTLNEYAPENRARAEHTASLLRSQDVPARVIDAEAA
jgi:hypothetical protein